jgi:hypothetical protein
MGSLGISSGFTSERRWRAPKGAGLGRGPSRRLRDRRMRNGAGKLPSAHHNCRDHRHPWDLRRVRRPDESGRGCMGIDRGPLMWSLLAPSGSQEGLRHQSMASEPPSEPTRHLGAVVGHGDSKFSPLSCELAEATTARSPVTPTGSKDNVGGPGPALLQITACGGEAWPTSPIEGSGSR